MRAKLVVLACFILLSNLPLFAAEAKPFFKKLDGAAEITSSTDHLDVIFVTGWISSKDNFLMTLLSSNSKTAATIGATGTYFDGEQLKNSWVIENEDVGNHLDRPWGVSNKVLLSDIPADTLIPNITVRFEIHKDDRIKQILSLFQTAEPALGASVEPYLTYANLLDGFFTSQFGTDKTKLPFLLDSGLSDASVTATDGIYEHYIIAVSPNKDGDAWFSALDGSKLSYSDTTKQVTYDGKVLTDHSYAVFQIKKGKPLNIPKLLYSSNAPWSALAKGSFYLATFPRITKKEDISGVETTYIKNLNDCLGLLQRELQFSAYDRAIAMYAFAEQAKALVSGGCANGSVSTADCKTPQLDFFESGLAAQFGALKPDVSNRAKTSAQSVNNQLRLSLQ